MARVLPFASAPPSPPTPSHPSSPLDRLDEAAFDQDWQTLRVHRPAVLVVLAHQTHLFAEKVRLTLGHVDESPVAKRARTIAAFRACGADLCAAYLEQQAVS